MDHLWHEIPQAPGEVVSSRRRSGQDNCKRDFECLSLAGLEMADRELPATLVSVRFLAACVRAGVLFIIVARTGPVNFFFWNEACSDRAASTVQHPRVGLLRTTEWYVERNP